MSELLNLSDPALDAEVWRLNGRKGTPGEAWGKREVISERPAFGIGGNGILNGHSDGAVAVVSSSYSDDAKQWDGWGTALKPAIEPIILARKPLVGTVAQNVLEHGVGGLNIDACRVGSETRVNALAGNKPGGASLNMSVTGMPQDAASTIAAGRFPANVLLDEHAAEEMDKQSGISTSRPHSVTSIKTKRNAMEGGAMHGGTNVHNDSGGASRFFPVFKYQAKAPKKERPVIECEDGTKIQHPTVKPLALMEWCLNLVTPPDGVVLDPFAGSGTTVEAAIRNGFNWIAVERDDDYARLIRQRIDRSEENGGLW